MHVKQTNLFSYILLFVLIATTQSIFAQSDSEIPSESGSYQELVNLYTQFLKWQNIERGEAVRSITSIETDGERIHPDYRVNAVNTRKQTIELFHEKLNKLKVSEWSISQQVEFLAVRAKIDQEYFKLHVTRPWSRDPGFYVDKMLRLTFTDLPVSGEELLSLQRQLNSIALLVEEAQSNLTNVASDYADLAIFNLNHSDGVGHGYPYRADPPDGVIGWYQDLQDRAEQDQTELLKHIREAKTAVQSFDRWLRANREKMVGKAGVGKDNFDWYLKHVKMLPFTSEQIVVLGERELDRLWASFALEQHRNARLPKIKLPKSEKEYQQRIDDTDRRIREFLVNQEIITIPAYVGKLDTNVPWIVRDKGPNFWEQIQYRDPSPDHLHAVIPGHRFDRLVEKNNTHPIRGQITDGVRTEGWGVYLEEGMMHAGLFDDLEQGQQVRELIYLFGIFRAARMPVDVWLQTNQMTVNQAVDYWMERVPYLDEDVARVDAEIYLRRPPGYGLGYMTGMIQMQSLLAERKRQLKDEFNLKEFHDALMRSGRLPLSLIRWEMTGLDNEVKGLWSREALPK